MSFRFLIYDKFPLISKGLGFIVSKSKPNSVITYSKSIDDFFVKLIEFKYDLILADFTSEENDFFELIKFLLPSLSYENRIIVFVEDSNTVFKERCSLISPYIFFWIRIVVKMLFAKK